MIIGASHHFLRTRRKSQNSRRIANLPIGLSFRYPRRERFKNRFPHIPLKLPVIIPPIKYPGLLLSPVRLFFLIYLSLQQINLK